MNGCASQYVHVGLMGNVVALMLSDLRHWDSLFQETLQKTNSSLWKLRCIVSYDQNSSNVPPLCVDTTHQPYTPLHRYVSHCVIWLYDANLRSEPISQINLLIFTIVSYYHHTHEYNFHFYSFFHL